MGCRWMRFVNHAGEFGRCVDYDDRAGYIDHVGCIDHAACVRWWIYRSSDGSGHRMLRGRAHGAAANSKH